MSSGVVLLHYNATPHKSVKTLEWVQKYNWETLEHPAYSPDLAPSDYHLFGALKRALSGERFTTDNELKHAVLQFFSQRDEDFYRGGIMGLVDRWDKCLNKFDNYEEK